MKKNESEKKKELICKNILKKYGNVIAVDNISFYLEKGVFMSLLGPSGCGKTTTLRTIAGFLKPTSGTIHFRGREITHLPPFKREIGLVFQNYALWPHMTVFENIAFGLKLKKIKLREIKQKVAEVLSLVDLSGLDNRFPRELSGGQQQRVALARIIALDLNLWLMDEPLSNLDRKLRVYMRVELKRLQKKLGITTLYVTHDQEEALSMSDIVVLMNNGKITQIGTPVEIYEKPKNNFIAEFIGNINIFEGKILEVSNMLATFKTRWGFTLKAPINEGLMTKNKLNLAIRPEKVGISNELIEGKNVISGKVKSIDYFGSSTGYHVELEKGCKILIEAQNLDTMFNIGDKVYVKLYARHCFFIEV